jgi:hypothetical protein
MLAAELRRSAFRHISEFRVPSSRLRALRKHLINYGYERRAKFARAAPERLQ